MDTKTIKQLSTLAVLIGIVLFFSLFSDTPLIKLSFVAPQNQIAAPAPTSACEQAISGVTVPHYLCKDPKATTCGPIAVPGAGIVQTTCSGGCCKAGSYTTATDSIGSSVGGSINSGLVSSLIKGAIGALTQFLSGGGGESPSGSSYNDSYPNPTTGEDEGFLQFDNSTPTGTLGDSGNRLFGGTDDGGVQNFLETPVETTNIQDDTSDTQTAQASEKKSDGDTVSTAYEYLKSLTGIATTPGAQDVDDRLSQEDDFTQDYFETGLNDFEAEFDNGTLSQANLELQARAEIDRGRGFEGKYLSDEEKNLAQNYRSSGVTQSTGYGVNPLAQDRFDVRLPEDDEPAPPSWWRRFIDFILGGFRSVSTSVSPLSQLAAIDFCASGAVTGPTSNDPQKDILEVSRAFAALHGVEACSLAKSMNAVFGVECNFQQNCGGGTTFIGSFQQGLGYVAGAERKLGGDLTRMSDLVSQGKINQSVYNHMLAAACQGKRAGPSRARLHHMYATMLALVEHVRMEKALQARVSSQFERAGAHVVFQFSPGNVGAAFNSGRDRNSPWGSANGIPAGATVFQAARLAGSSSYKGAGKVKRGIDSMNCSTTAGYDRPSGSGVISSLNNNSPLQNALSNSPLGQFFGIPQNNSSSNNPLQYSDGYLDPNQNPTLRPENDPSQRALDKDSDKSSSSPLDLNTPGSSDDTSTTSSGGDDSSTFANVPSTSTTAPIAPTTIENLAPTLLCLPNTVDQGEDAIIMYTCRDGSETATLTSGTGEHVSQGNDSLGKFRVNPDETTTYTLSCAEETTTTCTVNVAKPALALIPEPTHVSRGQTARIFWRTKDTNSCVVTSSDPNHRNWERQGTQGDAITPTLTQNTTFILTCETTTGQLREKSVMVGVN